MTTIGYARVSTDGQTLDAQQAALREAGCEKVFAEKVSGAKIGSSCISKGHRCTNSWRYADRLQAR
jgi:DNA invertase Pin-like site-specific DNA recombinase